MKEIAMERTQLVPPPRVPRRKSTGLRVAVAVAGTVAPAATARWLARQFLTPRALPVRPEQAAVLAQAHVLPVPHRDRQLATYAWGTTGPTVLLVHGWSGRAAQLAAFVAPLRARGLRVVAFDAPGHGTTGRGRTDVFAMADAVRAVADHVGGVHAVIAHSMGALATARAIRTGTRAERVVMIAPVCGPAPWLDRLADLAGLDELARARVAREVGVIAGATVEQADLALEAPWLDLPVLAAYDRGDPFAEPARVEAALDAIGAVTRLEVPGGGHFRILRDSAVIAAAVDHVAAEVGASARAWGPRDRGFAEAIERIAATTW
jgi:pimeloyl-ACP methyl ester carboxylesterase